MAATQGGHQVAQKSTSTTFPSKSSSFAGSPAKVTAANGGAVTPGDGGMGPVATRITRSPTTATAASISSTKMTPDHRSFWAASSRRRAYAS
ncbi:MAG: hypothetical protein AAFN74_03420 [Myxococcota bacterium]